MRLAASIPAQSSVCQSTTPLDSILDAPSEEIDQNQITDCAQLAYCQKWIR